MSTKNIKWLFLLAVILYVSGILSASSSEIISFKLADKPVFQIGDKDVMFGSINSLCEDASGNVYILDSKMFKVFKISKDGGILTSWGDRGQGPSEWLQGHSIFLLPDGNVALNDNMNHISIFDRTGKFLKRIFVPGSTLNLSMLSEDIFYGWQWSKNDKEQVLVDKDGKVIKRFFSISTEMFSVNTPDETGRYVKSSHFSYWYSPHLTFTRMGDYAAIGVSNKYEIIIIKTNGTLVTKITRNITADRISDYERMYFEKEILDNNNLPQHIKNKFFMKIPKSKNYYDSVILSNKHIWVCRLSKDATAEESPFDVDIFDYQGNYKGTFQLKHALYFVGDKYLYFVKDDDNGSILLSKYGYNLK